jgi:hypothetical protein
MHVSTWKRAIVSSSKSESSSLTLFKFLLTPLEKFGKVNKKMKSHRWYGNMKGVLTLILMTGAILLAISSCATVSKEPLGPGELRLLSMDVPLNGNFKTDAEYWVNVNFQADGHPEIRRACFYWSGDGPHCVRVRAKDVKYGSDAYVQVPIYARLGSNRLECSLEYVREGKVRRTDTVTSFVIGY